MQEQFDREHQQRWRDHDEKMRRRRETDRMCRKIRARSPAKNSAWDVTPNKYEEEETELEQAESDCHKRRTRIINPSCSVPHIPRSVLLSFITTNR